MRDRYAHAVEFFIVYIKEAHPEDGWVLKQNRRAQIAVSDPGTLEERTELAQTCAVRMRTSLPVLIDELDDEAARQYGGWPDRLYLVSRDGRIAYQGRQGPFGFRPAELDAAIQAELA